VLMILLLPLVRERRRKILDDFGVQLFKVLRANADKISETVAKAKSQGFTKPEFVANVKSLISNTTCSDILLQNHFGIYFKVFDGADAFECVLRTVKEHCKSLPKLEEVRKSLCGGLKVSL